jgi:hypothetical protein
MRYYITQVRKSLIKEKYVEEEVKKEKGMHPENKILN